MIHTETFVTCDVDGCDSRSAAYHGAGAARAACIADGWALQQVAALDRWGRPSTRTEHVCKACREAQGKRATVRSLVREGAR